MFDTPLLRGVFLFGHSGVDFFFVISGFIILFVHYGDVNNPARLTRYVKRRFIRLLPTYWIALSLMAAALAIGSSQGAPSIADLAWSISLLPSNHPMVLSIAWTLQYEVMFYVFFGVLIANRTAGLIVLVVWISAMATAIVTPISVSWLPIQFYSPYILEFIMGMAAAYVLRNHKLPRAQIILAAGLLLFGVAAVLEDIHILDGLGNPGRLAYGVPSAIIVLAVAAADRQNRLRVPYVLQTLGAASYSIYLFQFIFINTVGYMLLVTRLDQQIPLIAHFLVLASAAVVGGVVVSRWIEHPLMRWMRGQQGAAHATVKAIEPIKQAAV
jgi:peptidoglycan/LPS O-acetylase OafA/YrhL